MKDWVQVRNSDFIDFNIEDLEVGLTKRSIWIPRHYFDQFIKLIEYKAGLSVKQKSEVLNGFFAGSGVDRHERTGLIQALALAAALEESACGLEIGNTFMFKYDFSSVASDDEAMKDGIIFEEKSILRDLSSSVGIDHDEYILGYSKSNMFGAFEGSIITNMRLITKGRLNSQIGWGELKSFSRGGLFSLPKANNEGPITATGPIYSVLEAMVNFKRISFAMLVREGGSFGFCKGILLIGVCQ